MNPSPLISTPKSFPKPFSKSLQIAQRAVAGQQVGYFCLMARMLSGMANDLPWSDLNKPERRRASAMLARLEHDIALARLILRDIDTDQRTLQRERPRTSEQ